MKRTIQVAILFFASATTLVVIAAVGLRVWTIWEYHLPAEQVARQRFASHRSDFQRYATLVKGNGAGCFIRTNGEIFIGGMLRRKSSEFRELGRILQVKFVTVGEDGAVQFALFGYGGALIDDSYLGILYDRRLAMESARGFTTVASLDDLPKEHGEVVSGFYVVPIESDWYLYRLECKE